LANPTLMEKLADRYDALRRYHASTGIPVSYPVFLISVFSLSVGTAWFLFNIVKLGAFLSMIGFVALMTLIMGIPISMRNTRIDSIDQNLPDVLKHLAIILRSGGTTESALDEVANAGYGSLSDDLRNAVRGLRSGRTFDDVLLDSAVNSGSRLFKRCAIIIIDAKKAGAGIADVMYAISEDAREATRIRRERVSRTMMHVIFLFLATLFIAPFIFGFTLAIVSFIGTGMSGAVTSGQGAASSETMGVQGLDQLLVGFIAMQVTLTAFAIGVIREGKMLKYILNVPFMILLALLVYEGGKWFCRLIVGTG